MSASPYLCRRLGDWRPVAPFYVVRAGPIQRYGEQSRISLSGPDKLPTVGDIAPQGGPYPCAVNTQIKTRQGDRFAQAALRLCSSFVQRRDLRNYPTFIRLNVELVGSRTSRQREPAPASETPPRPCRRVCYCSAAPNAYPATYPRSFAGAEHRYSTKDFLISNRRCPRTSFPAPG